MSGGDIAKQLPSEHALFVSVNGDFLKVRYRSPQYVYNEGM